MDNGAPMIEYDDFVIQISPSADGEHAVTVIRSPAGKGGGGKLAASLIDLTLGGGTTGVARGIGSLAARAASKPLPPENIGGKLFDALFSKGVLDLFLQSYGTSTGLGRRLRVRLQLNVDDASVSRLAALPWELMYQQSRQTFLVRSADVTVVRELDIVVSGYRLKDVIGPLRVLFVMSNPHGDLKLTDEKAAIQQQLAEDLRDGHNRRQIEPEFLENVTFAALEELLRRDDYHIIHFMGHGRLDARERDICCFTTGLVPNATLATFLNVKGTLGWSRLKR